MAQSPGPICLSSPQASSHNSHHSHYDPYTAIDSNDYLNDSPTGGSPGEVFSRMMDMENLDDMGAEMGLNMEMALSSPGLAYGHAVNHETTGSSRTEMGLHEMTETSTSNGMHPNDRRPSSTASHIEEVLNGHSTIEQPPADLMGIDVSHMPTHAEMQSLLGSSGFRMDKQAYAAALLQHQAKQQLSRGNSGEDQESLMQSNRDAEDQSVEPEVEVISRPPSGPSTRSVSNKRRRVTTRQGASESTPEMPHATPSLLVKEELPTTPKMTNGTVLPPPPPGRNLPGPSSPEIASKASVQRSLGIGSVAGPGGMKTPRKGTMAGRKRIRDDQEGSASGPSASDTDTPQAGPGPSTISAAPPVRKGGMIFKNAFGASDVEDDGDEELEGLEGEDGEDGATSRSVSKGKRKIPSNGVGLNPTDGQPGGFELVDKDGDSMRRKIRIEYITDKSRRHITFSKRKAGIMKKAYELSTLTGTQVLLLVVSETGLVYTFTTAKLQPLVTKPEGKNLIQSCLNAPDNREADAETGEASAPAPSSKKERGLAIRPLKLNAEETGKLAASAASAIPVPPIPDDNTPRPRKRLPSGKNRRPSKKEQQTLQDAQPDNVGNPLSEGNHPTSESDTQAVEATDQGHRIHPSSASSASHDLQAAQQQSRHEPQPIQHQPHHIQTHHQPSGHMMGGAMPSGYPPHNMHPSIPPEYHMSPTRASINHQAGYYHSHAPMMGLQPNFSYPTPPTHAPPQYLSGVHPSMTQAQGFDPNHFGDANPFVAHQHGMAM